jgi:hypothetical protein
MRTNRLQYDDALRTAIEMLACFGKANGDRGSREALAARSACAPEPLGSGQARRVDERKVAHAIHANNDNQGRHQA